MTFVELAIALGHETREQILALLSEGEALTMGALVQATQRSGACVCHHVDVLEKVGVLRRTKRGKNVWVSAASVV